ncbi:MAG: hypothetical protein M3Y56_05215, partial [Armatimonadota bacterium]|nr:hypothetical protein [Armatimonadota bacterium]
ERPHMMRHPGIRLMIRTGGATTEEFRFVVARSSSLHTSATWQRMLLLRPWIREVDPANLWAIRVIGK